MFKVNSNFNVSVIIMSKKCTLSMRGEPKKWYIYYWKYLYSTAMLWRVLFSGCLCAQNFPIPLQLSFGTESFCAVFIKLVERYCLLPPTNLTPLLLLTSEKDPRIIYTYVIYNKHKIAYEYLVKPYQMFNTSENCDCPHPNDTQHSDFYSVFKILNSYMVPTIINLILFHAMGQGKWKLYVLKLGGYRQ